jgi:DinB superfamily
MTPAERQRAIAHLEETRDRLMHTIRARSREQFQYKPSADCWSIAENFEHLIFVEGRILAGIDRALQKGSTVPCALDDDTLMRRVVDRTARRKGPDALAPTGRWPQERLVLEFQAVRNRSLEFAKTTTAELRKHSYPHPFFGELDCYQWLLVIPLHGERHRLQIEEVAATPGFPRAAIA